MLTERCSEKYLKKLIRSTELEDALKKLDKLTQEEARMAAAEILKATHIVDKRVVAIENRVSGVDDQVAGVSNQVASVDDRVSGVNDRVKVVDNRVMEAIAGV